MVAELEEVLPDYQTIGKAPTIEALERKAEFERRDIEAVIHEERERWYKSVEFATGVVYLIKNPATWELKNGAYLRPKPQRMGTLNDLRGWGGTRRKKRVGDVGSAF